MMRGRRTDRQVQEAALSRVDTLGGGFWTARNRVTPYFGSPFAHGVANLFRSPRREDDSPPGVLNYEGLEAFGTTCSSQHGE